MTTQPTLEDIKTLIFQLPLDQQFTLMEDLENKLDTLTFMKLSETGFTEWHDPEEDIYDHES